MSVKEIHRCGVVVEGTDTNIIDTNQMRLVQIFFSHSHDMI